MEKETKMYKSMLQELCHRNGWNLAEYVTVKEGQDHCPRFTTKCTVRGICFESPHNQCKSSKEAQNLAAKYAYEHLSALLSMAVPHSVTSPSPSSLPAPGFVFSGNKNLSVKPVASEELQVKNSQTALPSGGQSAPANENLPKGTPHLYKNRLQHLAQKNNLSLPVYSCEYDGPPHAPRFKATVTVDGTPYKTMDFFSTLREAEQAAARIAFESLSNGAIQEDDSLYKSLLQEFSQRNGMLLPSYNTERIGPSHSSTFKCTVEVGGRTFTGAGCKTKKLAEMNAAKVAFNDLTQCKDTHTLADDKAREHSEIGSGSLHPLNTNSLQSTTAASNALQTHVEVPGGGTGSSSANGKKKATAVSPNCVESDKNGWDVTGNEPSSKKPKNSTSPDDEHFIPEFPLINAVPHCSANDAGKAVGDGDTRTSKIVIYSRESTMAIPQGASILPCSNDKWLVTSQQQESNQNC